MYLIIFLWRTYLQLSIYYTELNKFFFINQILKSVLGVEQKLVLNVRHFGLRLDQRLTWMGCGLMWVTSATKEPPLTLDSDKLDFYSSEHIKLNNKILSYKTLIYTLNIYR